MTRLRRPRLVSGFGLIAGAAIVGAFGITHMATDASSRASAGNALAQFRFADPQPAPRDGVYTYETSGSESTDGPHSSSRQYPATTTVTVIHTGCGVRLRWDVLSGRSTTWTLCNSDGDVALRGVDETNAILGDSDRTTYSCTQSALHFKCRAAHGSESGSVIELGEAIVTVSGAKFAALAMRIAATLTGSTDGTETTDFRLAPGTLLPLAISVTNETSHKQAGAGIVHYRENATLQLLSATPQR